MSFYFSVITVVKNAEKTINKSLSSLYNQDFQDFEHIIIDGGSTDSTKIKILNKIKNKKNVKFIQKKLSLYESLNYANKLVTGKYITLMHADDIFCNNKILSEVKKKLDTNKPDLLYGNIGYKKNLNDSKYKRIFKPGIFTLKKLYQGWHYPHTCSYISNTLLKKNMKYLCNFSSSSDYDYMIRICLSSKKIIYIDKMLTIMQLGGLSTASIYNIIISNYNSYKILKLHKFKFPFFMILNKIFLKIKGLKF